MWSSTKLMSSTQFYDLLKQTKPNQVATNFGNPDEMITLKSAAGEAAGVVWVYHNAVAWACMMRALYWLMVKWNT